MLVLTRKEGESTTVTVEPTQRMKDLAEAIHAAHAQDVIQIEAYEWAAELADLVLAFEVPIDVTVVRTRSSNVRLGFTAPKDHVSIYRSELLAAAGGIRAVDNVKGDGDESV